MLALPLASLAHDTWLASTERHVPTGKALEFAMTSGERFPAAETAIAPNRIETANCHQSGKNFALKPDRKSDKTLHLKARPGNISTTTCWVQLKPRELTLDTAKVQEYLDEIDVPQATREAWAKAPEPRQWNETYTKNAKVIVSGADAAVTKDQPVGLKLELLVASTPASSPTLSVTALLDGKPLAGLSVALTSERAGAVQRQRTNAQGQAAFPQPTAGRWMLSATDLRPDALNKGLWTSQFSTLVWDVK